MYLRHLQKVSDDRKAVAPYNFVELPSKVVLAEPLPDGDRYHSDRHTGTIKCTLTTESPLYIRCGLTPIDFQDFGEKSTSLEDLSTLRQEQQDRRINFFYNPKNLKPTLPGSSLRGMIRNLIEIVSFSKMDRVSDHQRLFFRAVAGNEEKDSLARRYKKIVKPEKVKAGYLKYENNNWCICPAKSIKNVTFAWVRESSLSLDNLVKFNDANYCPQYIPVSYSTVSIDSSDRANRTFAENVSSPETYPNKPGILVTSGNMKLANENSPRRNHCLVFEVDPQAKPLKIDPVALQHYCNSLTDFQAEPPFSQEKGVLEENRPVFFSSPKNDVVAFFGQSPNFRIPYSPNGDGHASTVLDFLPEALRNPALIDIADAIFGYVDRNVEDKSRAGRIFVSDATTNAADVWLDPISPKILGGPKPTTFQHYLAQTSANRKDLNHYASVSGQETVIRGHKLYWHKRDINVDQIRERDLEKLRKGKKQLTKIRPIKPNVQFAFDIHFENLSAVELGTLLWVVSLSNDKAEGLGIGKAGEQYCFSLGMGKPLGMGAVKIDYELHLSDRPQRYCQLFDQNSWAVPEKTDTHKVMEACVKAFESFMLDSKTGIHEIDHPEGRRATRLAEVPRIEMLLAMLQCDRTPDAGTTRYMTIENKAYVNRPVLPTPLQIMNIKDRRQLALTSVQNNASKQISQKQSTTLKTPISARYYLEQELDAEVLKKKGVQITYKVLITDQKLTEREHKNANLLEEGQRVKVKVTALKEDGSIKNVKFTE